MSKKLGSINEDDFTEESSSLKAPMLGKNKSAAASGKYPEDLIGGGTKAKLGRKQAA